MICKENFKYSTHIKRKRTDDAKKYWEIYQNVHIHLIKYI